MEEDRVLLFEVAFAYIKSGSTGWTQVRIGVLTDYSLDDRGKAFFSTHPQVDDPIWEIDYLMSVLKEYNLVGSTHIDYINATAKIKSCLDTILYGSDNALKILPDDDDFREIYNIAKQRLDEINS